MSEPSDRQTQEKIRSLRIDPSRKDARRRSRGAWFGGVIVGLLLGAAGSVAYKALTIQPLEVRTVRARAVEATGGEGTSAAGAASAVSAGAGAATDPSGAAADLSPDAIALTANGYVTPRHRVALSPRVMGQVAWVGIEKGDRVEKDQVLVRLKDDDYKAQVKQSEARLASAEARLRELEAGSRPEEIERARADLQSAEAALKNGELQLGRVRKLVEDNPVDPQFTLDDALAARDQARARRDGAKHTLDLLIAGPRKEQIDAARAEVDSAGAALEYSKILLEDTIIRAPAEGTVLEKLIEAGELVSPQSFGGTRGARTELLSLANLSDLQVEVDVNESDFAKIRMGQPARVTLDAYPDRRYSGRVREIAPEANRQKATVQIKIQILDPDALVLPEMNARVDFLAGAAGPSATQEGRQAEKPDSAAEAGSEKAPNTGKESEGKPGGKLEGIATPGKGESRRRVFVPREAVARRGDETVVFVAIEGRAVLRKVALASGVFGGKEVEATSGLIGGEPVIVTHVADLQDGRRIRVSSETE